MQLINSLFNERYYAISRGNAEMKKVIYFDEGSTTDMLEIKNGGSLFIKQESKEESGDSGSANFAAKTKFLLNSLFFKAEANVEASLNTSFTDTDYFNKTITNTLMSDALDYFHSTNDIVKSFSNYRVEIVKDSIAYIQMISPYLAMIDSANGIKVEEDISVAINKINSTLKESKGYYEVLAKKGSSKKIFRFNNKSFRNNYGLQDLQNMDLTFYGVKVGKMREDYLNFAKSIAAEETVITSVDEAKIKPKELEVYDIVLAGVE